MEKSKKLVCLLLAICALSALCAVGASAEQTISLHNHSSRSDQYAVLGWSVDPDYFIYEANTALCTIGSQNYFKTYDGPSIAVLRSDNSSFSQVYMFCPNSGSAISDTGFYRNGTNWQAGEHSTITIDSDSFYFTTGLGYRQGYTSSNIPIVPFVNENGTEFTTSVLLRSGFSSSEPLPEPEPDPDEYKPIPDVYDTVTPTLYFTNYKSTGDASFTYLNRSFSSFPSPDYAWTTQFPDVIVGAFYDNFSLVSQPLDSLCGQTSIVFTDPLGNFDTYDVTLNQRGTRAFTNVEIWLVSGSEPSISGFQYFTCPSDWVKTTLWRYPISAYSTEYVCNFQINFPEDYVQTVGFTPVNFFVRIYRSTVDGQGVGRPYDVWYNVSNFVLGSYARPSSDPEDIPPTPYDPPFTDPSNPGQEVTNALDEEQSRIENAYNPEEGQAAADSTFDLSALGSAFGRLVDGMGYTGTDFHFYMPSSGNVPFLNTTLWQQSEIPFKTWIDALPPAILTVIRFLAWLGLGFSFAGMIRKLISDINGGDKD